MDIAVQRLHNQQLVQTHCRTPGEVVAWLGAVQAQEYLLAKWALGLRLPDATDAAIEQAFAAGDILRTHVMRPTWHFVAPADIRWLLALTAPRVHIANGYMYRQLELDDALLARSNAVIARVLAGGHHLTRAELQAALAQAGIHAEGLRLGYILHYAELEAVVCSGARRGKQQTYALLDERAPQAKTLTHAEALAELTTRYFTSHGPATIKDFAWWSGLTVAEVRTGLELAKPGIVEEVINDKSYWYAASMPAADAPAPKAYLLPPYDEYSVGYKDHGDILDPQYREQVQNPVFIGLTLIDCQLVGAWRRTFSRGSVVVESVPFRPLNAAENEAFAAAAQRFADFLNMPLVIAETTGV